MKLYVSKEKNVKLYIGLIEGKYTITRYWNGGVDSSLQKTVNVEIITVMDKNNTEEFYNFLVLDNNETVEINDSNIERLYNYFIYNKTLEELEIDKLTEFDREIMEGFKSNMFCDNTGFCSGASCRNYYKCNG